jgi:hypothetical protein
MGWREDANFGNVNVEGAILPQSHLAGGLGLWAGGTDGPTDDEIPEGRAIIFYDGTDIIAKRKVSGTVTSATLNSAAFA